MVAIVLLGKRVNEGTDNVYFYFIASGGWDSGGVGSGGGIISVPV